MWKKILTLAMGAVLALSMAACGNTAAKPTATPQPVDLAAFGEKVLSEHEFGMGTALVDPQDEMGGSVLANSFAGLTDLDTQQCLVYATMMSMNMGELALVQVKNADDVSKVQEIFQARIDAMVNGGAWYPEPTEIWTNQSQVVTNGNYVMLVVNTEKDAIVEEFNALFQ